MTLKFTFSLASTLHSAEQLLPMWKFGARDFCILFVYEFVYLPVYMMLIPKILKLIKESLLCFLVYIFSSIDTYGTLSHTRNRENPFSVI